MKRKLTTAVKHGIDPASPGTVTVKVERVDATDGTVDVVEVAGITVDLVVNDYSIVVEWPTDTAGAPATANTCCETILSIDQVKAANLPTCTEAACTPDAGMPDLVDPCLAVGPSAGTTDTGGGNCEGKSESKGSPAQSLTAAKK